MNRSFLIILFCFLLLGCKEASKELAASEEQTIEYQIDKNKYAIVVVRGEGMSDEDVKGVALRKAAEKTRGEHFRYFTIEKEGQVQAMTPGNAPDNGQRNMYYDLIESDNFGRERFDDEQGPEANSYPAYRIVFTCYLEKTSEKAIDACDLISCGKRPSK